MTEISGFTFIHNALDGGYPLFEAMSMVMPYVDEVVVVDMASTDGTRRLLDSTASHLGGKVKIVDGVWWPGKGGRCLSYNHSLHEHHCKYDLIWHFEADEVHGIGLAQAMWMAVEDDGARNVAIHRIQLEQNFQRIRWNAVPVHRIFPKGSVTKSGHSTMQHLGGQVPDLVTLGIVKGILWDVTNCFRDNWLNRIKQNAELHGDTPNMLFVPEHINQSNQVINVDEFLRQPQWTWTYSPFFLPGSLEGHIGKTKYVPDMSWFEFITNEQGWVSDTWTP